MGEQCPAQKGDQVYLVSSKRLYTSHTYGSDKSPGDTETSWNVQSDIPKTNFGVEQPDGWLGDNISNSYQTSFYSWGLWKILEITKNTGGSVVTATVQLKKITRRQTRYGTLVRGWDWRTTPDLLEQAEEARQKLNLSQTEFIERAITELIERTND